MDLHFLIGSHSTLWTDRAYMECLTKAIGPYLEYHISIGHVRYGTLNGEKIYRIERINDGKDRVYRNSLNPSDPRYPHYGWMYHSVHEYVWTEYFEGEPLSIASVDLQDLGMLQLILAGITSTEGYMVVLRETCKTRKLKYVHRGWVYYVRSSVIATLIPSSEGRSERNIYANDPDMFERLLSACSRFVRRKPGNEFRTGFNTGSSSTINLPSLSLFCSDIRSIMESYFPMPSAPNVALKVSMLGNKGNTKRPRVILSFSLG